MYRNIPPLGALRAFEAVARHMSFTRAAGELHLTQAAVSYRVKSLEARLGVRLFRRLTRRLLLTDEGQALLPAVRGAFDGLSAAIARVADQGEAGLLTVALRPYFAARWLSPRLRRFWDRHPQVELRLHHTHATVDFAREDVDMAVRWGTGDWADAESELLFRTELIVVLSPDLARRIPLRTLDDLGNHTLLREADLDLWGQWLEAAGARGVPADRGPRIDDSNVRMQAALDGQGVDLVPAAMVAEELADGRLVAPFDARLTDYAYYIVYPEGALARPRIRAFRDWLLDEGRRAASAPRDAGHDQEETA